MRERRPDPRHVTCCVRVHVRRPPRHERSASPSCARSHRRYPASGSHIAMTARPTFQETVLELMKRLGTSEQGLSSEEAARRAQACGPNEMTTVHVGRKVLE